MSVQVYFLLTVELECIWTFTAKIHFATWLAEKNIGRKQQLPGSNWHKFFFWHHKRQLEWCSCQDRLSPSRMSKLEKLFFFWKCWMGYWAGSKSRHSCCYALWECSHGVLQKPARHSACSSVSKHRRGSRNIMLKVVESFFTVLPPIMPLRPLQPRYVVWRMGKSGF